MKLFYKIKAFLNNIKPKVVFEFLNDTIFVTKKNIKQIE